MAIGQQVTLKKIGKFYGKFQALSNVNIDVQPGEFLTILGSSGSGKTTLLKIITGFEKPSMGTLLIDGEDISNSPPYMRNIGMLFQNYALFPHLTVEENIAYPLKVRKMPKPEIKQAVKEMIDMVKLNGMETRFPKQLSGGQQQRVALARALVYRPPLLLLDEPLGALDKSLRHEMQFEIKRIQKELGITTISVTHDQEEALTMSDRICIMSNGVVQQCDKPENIYKKPKNKFVAEFMGNTNLVSGKLISNTREDGKLVTTVQTELSDTPFRIEAPSKTPAYNLPDLLIAMRPESIHLSQEKPEQSNAFQGKIVGSVFLGDSVSLQIKTANGQQLAVKISSEEFEQYVSKQAIWLYFYPASVTTIYEREAGDMLVTIDKDDKN